MAARKKVLSKQDKKTVGQTLAAIGAGFLPVASYMIAHQEVKTNPYLGILVVAALLFSAPTLAEWAEKWCKSKFKAWGFTILLEGVMVFSQIQELAISALLILTAINCHSAWCSAGAKVPQIRKISK